MYVNNFIAEFLHKNRLTQEKFADIVGVSRQTVNNWVHDKSSPTIENSLEIMLKYNLDYIELEKFLIIKK